jgi:hypothetical protein
MVVRYGVVDILWAALRAIDASADDGKEGPPVLRVKQEMLRAITELGAAKPKLIDSRQAAKKTGRRGLEQV